MSGVLPFPIPTPEDGRETPSCESAGDEIAWVLPGHGTSRVSCGKWVSRGHRSGGEVHYKTERWYCGRFDCPVCFRQGWVSREASRIEDRVKLGMLKSRRSRAIHVVVAPPSPLWHYSRTLSGYRTLRELAYRQAKARGLDGGVWVFHEKRLGDRWANSRGGLCALGPHFHVIGDGWITPGPEGRDWTEGTDWVVRNLGVRVSVFDTAYYLLTHAPRAARPGISPYDNLTRVVQTVTWAGSMAYGRLKAPEPLAEGVPVEFCAVCRRLLPKTAWFGLVWEGSGPPPTVPGVCRSREWRADGKAPEGTWQVLNL
jgi:hypothetical protein